MTRSVPAEEAGAVAQVVEEEGGLEEVGVPVEQEVAREAVEQVEPAAREAPEAKAVPEAREEPAEREVAAARAAAVALQSPEPPTITMRTLPTTKRATW